MWIGSLIAIGIAGLGTLASLLIPRTKIAEPSLKLQWENLAVPKPIAQLIRRDRGLLLAILIATIFWFLGAATQMAVNTLGKSTLKLSDTRTSLMVSGIGFGIMIGCIVAGFAGKGRSGQSWIRLGSWMLLLSLLLIAWLGSGRLGMPSNAGSGDVSILASLLHADMLEWALRASMVLLGLSAGMFVVPVQVFLQQAPPPEFKGRLLGVQNLFTWIGILLAAAYFEGFGMILRAVAGPGGDASYQWAMFASLGAIILPVCLFYRLPNIPNNAAAVD